MSAESQPIDYAIALPTFIGSLLSFLASAVAIGFQIARPPRRHFRHALIVNLLVAGMLFCPYVSCAFCPFCCRLLTISQI